MARNGKFADDGLVTDLARFTRDRLYRHGGGNLAPNPGFEQTYSATGTGAVGWYGIGNNTGRMYLDTSAARSGTLGLIVKPEGASTAAHFGDMPSTSYRVYEVSVWCKLISGTSATQTVGFKATFYDSAGAILSTVFPTHKPSSIGVGAWGQIKQVVTAPSGTARVNIALWVAGSADNTVAFDDVFIEDITNKLLAKQELGIASVSDYPSLDAAVSARIGKALYAGDVVATNSIPNFWKTRFVGVGSVVRGADTFYLNPKPAPSEVAPTNTVYVNAATGNDTYDGLTPDRGFKTLGGVYRTVLRPMTADMAAGAKWVIRLSGTFTEGLKMETLPDFPHGLVFEGDALVAGKPVTKITKATSSSLIGLWVEPGIRQLIVRNIEFSGFTNGYNGYGLLNKGGGKILVEDCVASTCDIGFGAIRNVDFAFMRCSAETGVPTGFVIQYSSSGVCDNCTASNATTGFSVTRNAVVHLDYCTATSCEHGVQLDMAARANILSSNFKKNVTGVVARGASEWVNTYSVFNAGTADANTTNYRHHGVSRESRLYGQVGRNEYEIGNSGEANEAYLSPKVLTGSTSASVLYTGSRLGVIPDGFFTEYGKRLRTEVYGEAKLSANAFLRLYVTEVDGSNATMLGELVINSNANVTRAFKADFMVLAKGTNSQTCFVSLVTDDGSKTSMRASVADFATEKRLRVYAQLGDAADTITLHNCESFLMG